MRVTQHHQELLRRCIAQFDREPNRQAYREGRFPRAELTKDVDKRYRWDLYYGSGADRIGRDSTGNPLPVWDTYTDAHIDTALRSIVAPLTEKAPA